MPSVTIIMNCLNGERYLKEALDSVYQQSFSDWEIIFVDNASSDSSVEIAKSYDQRLKYYNTQQTIPLYAARNFGLQYATGDFIAFLDVDDYWHPKKLEKQLQIMQTYPEVYFVCTGYFRKNQQLGVSTKHVGLRSHFLSFPTALKSYPVTLSSVLIRASVNLSKTPLIFEPTLNLTGDYELFIKLIHQFNSYYINDPLVTLRVHTTNLSAKLVRDWPEELTQTHARLISQLAPSSYEKKLMHKRYVKTCGLVFLASNQLSKVRKLTQKYLLFDAKLLLIYLATYNKFLRNWLLKVRGFT